MPTYTTSQIVPTGAVKVRAYKTSGYWPTDLMPSFPNTGSPAPPSPDVADVVVTPGAYAALTLPTAEPYIVCFVDGSFNVVASVFVQFNPQRAIQDLMAGSGQGAPATTVGTPVSPMLYVQTDGAAGSRLWVYTPATGWIAVAGF